jgi:two-component system nitrogen regulation sensor histidine kinase GlnL
MMIVPVGIPRQTGPRPAIDAFAVMAALPSPVLVVDGRNMIRGLNPAAEQFFDIGAGLATGQRLTELIAPDSPVFAIIEAARQAEASISEYGLGLESPRIGHRVVSFQVAPIAELPGHLVLSLHELSIAAKIDRQLSHRHAARSVTAMAAMLAHEVKNPLSGIRGAAQLLEQTAEPADRELTRLICEETDRICALVDRMDVFSDPRPLERQPVNIHEVLERVRKLAQTGFARHVRFVEDYDPSLPAVSGNRDMLIQVFLNLIKNAAEAVAEEGGEITISTAYQHGIKLAVAGSENRVQLPLVVTIADNGAGIPEDLRPHLFDPFVTTKRNGTGLGLALVAKIIDDHGGVIEFDSQPRRTQFRVMLPKVARDGAD